MKLYKMKGKVNNFYENIFYIKLILSLCIPIIVIHNTVTSDSSGFTTPYNGTYYYYPYYLALYFLYTPVFLNNFALALLKFPAP